ncbi:hypothetical protein [Fibrobacter sp. UWEL]|uniref:hypothetical protein n=1 Tax=Fibrobacter sp. UWEL TaxID=1896209 RepID=UPI000914E2EB|nr:hypothetical protein [Fibrobacter sp. UWEL]SHL30098.1 hypothetical protein SAMN05720468_12120 [Fibrobacter sp. UWEL]
MKKIKLIGVKQEGNSKLWDSKSVRIGVFASKSRNMPQDDVLEAWAKEHGEKGHCVIGAFENGDACKIMYWVLAYGGSAIWIRGCRFPMQYQDVCYRAFVDGRLLVISRNDCKKWTVPGMAWANHVVAKITDWHAYWLGQADEILGPICAKAIELEKKVEIYED